MRLLREGGYSAERRAKDSTLRITSTEGLEELRQRSLGRQVEIKDIGREAWLGVK